MIDRTSAQAWLDAYVSAWKTYDAQAIGNLFSEDAIYFFSPYSAPVQGRSAIVAAWLEEPDAAGSYDAYYEPLVIEDDRVVANGRSRYVEPDGSTLKAEWDNIFFLRFDAQGQCQEYREWYMKQPMK